MNVPDIRPHGSSHRKKPLLGLRRKPGRLALAMFRMPLRAYRHDKGWLLGQTFLELVHVGRKTGQHYEVVAMVLRYDADRHEAVVVAAWGPDTDWVRNLHAHLESSPLAVDGTLYLGTDTTDVVALRASDGAIRWRFNSPAAIKASPSYDGGRVFAADYQSAVFALDARTGKSIWRTNTSKVAPYGKGGFFSSPAVAFGRVYAARDDGTVYAFDEWSGKVDWSFDTGGYVYGSPAVAQVPGTPPTVYIGSEDGRFFALDARTGKPRWHYDVGGPVPGTATVIGHTVYVSSFKTRKTIGLDVRSHRRTFQIDQAGYTPMVSDGRRLYLVGYYVLVGLRPAPR